ncbi:MAG TPA: antibiotic biosynthesis monooxygenase [Thermomicrobiales bacterium]|nr:antibiotic biosynthesis monooxygenase [Thermomicrobiales bacterium]
MHARVTTFQVADGHVDALAEAMESNDITLVDGNKGAYLLIDRASGEAMTITLWASEQALQDALPFAANVFSGAADYLVGEPSRRVFEVASNA